MNKILNIDGRRLSFNTKTGLKLETKNLGKGKKRSVETLYLSGHRPKAYQFLHGKGGVLTIWNGRENIILLTEEQVKHWQEK